MSPMKWNRFISDIEGDDRTTSPDSIIRELAFDSRLVNEPSGIVFFAFSGNQSDGHHYISELYDKGVRNFVIEKEIKFLTYPQANFLVVPNTVSALQQIAKRHRESFNIPVVGITGSNGKTTVKEWLGIILGTSMKVVKSPKSYNSQIGVPLAIWPMDSSHEVGIFEAGISQPGEMDALEKMIRPTIGIFTTLGSAHDQGFESRDQKLAEKAQLFRNCKSIICSADNKLSHDKLCAQYGDCVISWSLRGLESSYQCEFSGGTLKISRDDRQLEFNIPFSLDIWVENAIHVIITALTLGCDPGVIQKGLDQLRSVKMRLEVKEGINGTYIVDDTYNNDLQALKAALEFLDRQQQRKKRTVILSEFVQASEDPAIYTQVNELLKQHEVSRLIGIGPRFHQFLDHLELPVEVFKSTSDLLKKIPKFSNEMILIKGARLFKLERVVEALQAKGHRTKLEINFESITHNLQQYRQLLSPEVKLMVMVKAFAYGSGNLEIANLLQYHNVDYLGVAYADEAVTLRKNGITIPIMVMNPNTDNLDNLNDNDIEIEVYSKSSLRQVFEFGDYTPGIHLKVETGMNRLGFTLEDMKEMIPEIIQSGVKVKGIFTHLSSSDDENEDQFTNGQINNFDKIYDLLVEALGYRPLKHAVNSTGIVRWPQFHFDMVRLGIGLHGIDGSGTLNLRPVSSLHTIISQIKTVRKGESIGYSRAGIASKDSVIATIPIGYADGYLRVFGKGVGKVMVNGKSAPTIGNICMDMTMIDVTGIDCDDGDPVTIFGYDPSVNDLADWANTIPYEILTNISERVKRIYLSE